MQMQYFLDYLLLGVDQSNPKLLTSHSLRHAFNNNTFFDMLHTETFVYYTLWAKQTVTICANAA